eukprot:comp18235_c0_seq1/m.19195 comp18235_c0_seq1/g.19195  ORF comp18235_c0_seq1/g.19195 comp18235_c0_seq1/m.19195 type:complete len:337 (-) comp18235_c0_seq1:264-1274(-)
MTTDLETVEAGLEDLRKSLLALKDSFSATSGQAGAAATPELTRDEHRTRMEQFVKAIASDASALSVSFSVPKPDIKEVRPLSRRLWDRVSMLYSLASNLPPLTGGTLSRQYHQQTSAILSACVSYVEALQATKGNTKTHLPATGVLWEACETFSNLPKDNIEAVGRLLKETEGLLLDAIKELSEELDNVSVGDDEDSDEDEEDEEWNEDEKKVAVCVLGLTRACGQAILKSRREQLPRLDPNTEAHLSYADSILGEAEDLSSLVDNLTDAIYPPQNTALVLECARKLATAGTSLLEAAGAPVEGLDVPATFTQTLGFLNRAIDHNMVKITAMCPQS